MYWFAKSTNGIDWSRDVYGATSYFLASACWSAVGWSRGWLVFVCCSTGSNAMYGLSYFDPWNESVGIVAGMSVELDVVMLRSLNFPKRESALSMPQRSAAQNGQYSAPM